MKAERRHELQQNELADWIAKTIEQIKPHAGVILGVIVAAIVAVFAWAYFAGTGETRKGPAWDAYYRAAEIEEAEQRVKELTRVADENPGTPAGLWARLTAGDSRLVEGVNKSFKDRLAGEEELSKAIDNFESVLEGVAKLPPAKGEMLKTRAMWGLAQAHESLAEVDEAIQEYEDIARQWPDSALGKASAVRAKKLSGMQDWFKWYASVDPTSIKPTPRQDRQPPLDFNPPRRPQPYDDLPDDPDLTLPGPLDLLDPPSDNGLLLDPPSGTSDKPSGEASDPATSDETTPPSEGETSPEDSTETPATTEDASNTEGGN